VFTSMETSKALQPSIISHVKDLPDLYSLARFL
jgi:hypothetical protein